MNGKHRDKYVPPSTFDLRTTWYNKIMFGGVVAGSAGLYAFQKEHSNGYLLFTIIFLPFFLGSVKGIRKHFREILGDDKAPTNIEIRDKPPIDKD